MSERKPGERLILPSEVWIPRAAPPPPPPVRRAVQTQLGPVSWRLIGAAAAFTALAVVAAGYIAAGTAGIVIACTALALAGLGVTRALVVSARPARRSGQARPGRQDQADFPLYLEIAADITWAGVSQRHYERGLRARLTRILDARLTERYGVVAADQPERAAALAGPELWPLIDPAAPSTSNHDAAGVSLDRLARAVTKLEEL